MELFTLYLDELTKGKYLIQVCFGAYDKRDRGNLKYYTDCIKNVSTDHLDDPIHI